MAVTEDVNENHMKVVVHEGTGDLNRLVYEASGEIGCSMSQYAKKAIVDRLLKDGYEVPEHIRRPNYNRSEGPGDTGKGTGSAGSSVRGAKGGPPVP